MKDNSEPEEDREVEIGYSAEEVESESVREMSAHDRFWANRRVGKVYPLLNS